MTEFVEFFSGLTYTPNDVQENGTLVLRSSNVSNGEVVDADNVYVNPQVVNSENVKVGDIVVVVRNGSRSLIGKHAQIKAFMPNAVIGAFMTGIRSECPEFTNALLNTSRFEEEIAMNMGATINQITGYMFSKMEFKVPCLDEQKKIGEYFEKLDHLITLHQREFKYIYCRFVINKYKYISENYMCIYTKIYGGLKMNNKLELYHGSGQIVEFPEIRKTRYTKDFSWGFYCTKSYEQAYRWAERKHEKGIVNVYSYIENSELNIKKFDGMCEEWLDFIAECRAGKTHPYDIVEGPMADDTIWNFVNDYLNKNISKEVFWEYARFKHPSHQISFHSIRALECLKYERSIAVENDTVE